MDRFLEEQEVELHQLMTPQSSEPKTETNEEEHSKTGLGLGIFSTGRTTIMSPSRHFDKNLMKGDHLGPSKHMHYHHHSEVNGSSCSTDHAPERTSPKKLKTDVALSDQPSPKRQKLIEHSQEPFPVKHENSSTPPLSLTTLPSTTLCDRSPGKAESSSDHVPKHVVYNTSGGAISPDGGSCSKTGASNILDKPLNSEAMILPTHSPSKLESVAAVVGSKTLTVSGDSHPPDITTYIGKPIAAESVVQ